MKSSRILSVTVIAVCAFVLGSCNFFFQQFAANSELDKFIYVTGPTLTVIFDENGAPHAASPAQIRTKGRSTPYELPKEPTWPNWYFTGWNTEKDGSGIEFTRSGLVTNPNSDPPRLEPLTRSITVYAQWSDIPPGHVLVTFDKNGGKIAPEPQTMVVAEGGTLDTFPRKPERMGFWFMGWNLDAQGTGSEFTQQTTVLRSMTVYARWEFDEGLLPDAPNGKHWVVFNPYGGEPAPATRLASHNEILTEPLLYREDYMFGGWHTDASFTSRYDFPTTPVTGDIVLHAKWEALHPEVFTVGFVPHGAFVSPRDQIISFGEKVSDSDPAVGNPERYGYTFEGWYTGSDYLYRWNFAGDIVTSDMELYALWKPLEFTVTFNTNGGGLIDPITVIYNEFVEKPDNPVKPGGPDGVYYFAGWYKDAALSEAWLFLLDRVDGDMTLYARWSDKFISVTGVILSPSDLIMGVGAVDILTVQILPEDATIDTVNWTTSNDAVVSVSNNGMVVAKSEGTAVITVTTLDRDKTAECRITVKAPKPVSGVRIEPSSLNMNIGQTSALTAVIIPPEAINHEVSWSSGDHNVALVDGDGIVKAVGPGTAVITVTT